MLTYRIKSASAQPSAIKYLIDRAKILESFLGRYPKFKEGDHVRLKKPKRNPIKGIITHVERDWSRCPWPNNTPLNITISLDEDSRKTKEATVKTNAKRILLIP